MRRVPPSLAPAALDGPYCRNCGACADVHYCPVCGQETRIELPTVGHFVAEFAEQTLALQGQLWRTLALLLFRPGLLTLEYVAGRRQRYVRPLRLYLALSILFFALLGVSTGLDVLRLDTESAAQLEQARSELRAEVAGDAADAAPATRKIEIDTGFPAFDRKIEARVAELLALPPGQLTERIRDTFTAWAPVAMFVLMPLFALALRLAYWRRGANYAVHLLFAVNFHSFVFLLLLLVQLPVLDAATDLLGLIVPLHLWLALRRVHGGGAIATALFAMLLLIGYLSVLALAMIAATAIPLTLL